MAKSSPLVPAAIQANLTLLRKRQKALIQLIRALESYLQCPEVPTAVGPQKSVVRRQAA